MQSFNLLVVSCLIYVLVLFLIAFWAERRAKRGQLGWLRSPVVYTLSISVYCTAWTFYGAVGSAARNGLEFVAIYLGPTLVFIGWWWFLRKLVRVGRTQRITSIADLISSRYGKSTSLAVIVTLLAVVGTTPYIALQLQSLTLSFSAFAPKLAGSAGEDASQATAFYVATGLAVFTIIFGTRNLDANERHHGVVSAIAVEAVVKLVALLSVGAFVVWGIFAGPVDILSRIDTGLLHTNEIYSGRWVALVFLSAVAIICLPRMFQVIVVENADERHLATASWAFPLYLFLISLFVLPIAITGLDVLPAGANPDLFVVTVPLAFDQNALALLAFLGGFSSATSMVIVAAIALSTMVSNHIVMPVWLYVGQDRSPASDDVRLILLRSRRVSIAVILLLGYLYFRFTGGSGALASIGLIAFLGVAQVLPALVGGLIWEGATRRGAIAGLCIGFFLWAYTLFLPSFEGGLILSKATLENGLFGIGNLRPHSLFGTGRDDPLIHALLWSLSANSLAFIVLSLATSPAPMERLQSLRFVRVFGHSTSAAGGISRPGGVEDLLILAQRILGRDDAMQLFRDAAKEQGKLDRLPQPTGEFIQTLERELAGSVGAATAHAMIHQVTGGEAISVEDLMAVADETAQIMEYSSRLEAQSRELAETAEQLRDANRKLTILGEQKDQFLSQVSHELRTPMTSIRSFAEILRDNQDLDRQKFVRFTSIIHDESIRLTRLLDEILDLSFLENGKIKLNMAETNLSSVIDRAVSSTQTQQAEKKARVIRDLESENIGLATDFDRLAQVLINLITNALKYSDADDPEIQISCGNEGEMLHIDVADNGPGIDEHDRDIIFEKFTRLSNETESGSVGLGLPISAEIMRNLGGSLKHIASDRTGAIFRLELQLSTPGAR
jgi:Na+/proline symporter/nitrogen-specific signal transduction histidine kinase